ncbi:RNA methyltransferase [Candidatus Igneacidithiobacillus taiwanensis]|uniref:RNA methyltransferase n=1 Tax=Candidatus Igneacidithiobacillus taiwanensis TaxID=1945924 RepID=UPI00289CB8E8|nr:RNA methyltransferase [Candidatus Igneacidithiobacillus taiwanensis]MCE5360269.1 RNA methyltransferase [Acidithiobacillus sp.]
MSEYREKPAPLHGAESLAQIRVVLVEPSHPGNIGSTARAMKVMGLTRLVLVRPRFFPHPEADALASGAEDVLQRAEVHDDLASALADCARVYGTTARDRHIQWPQSDARSAAQEMIAAAAQAPVAILFGRESSGLSNSELDLCQHLIQIPTGDLYHSLNLAQAVQILSYELQMASNAGVAPLPELPERGALVAEREGFYAQLRDVLLASGFLQAPREEHMMRRLRRLFDRAQPSGNEIDILRGILTEITRWASKGEGR